jgi:hypothetical protein
MRARVPGNGTKSDGGNEGSFNARFGEDCLNVNWFWNVMDARWKIAAWKKQYQAERQHSSLEYRTPAEFVRQMCGESGCGNGAAWKSKSSFSTPLGNPATGVRFPLSHSPGGDGIVTAEQVDGPDVVL